MKRVYLDYSATTPLDPLVVQAMMPYFQERFGNASSVHGFGREARAALEESRERVAALIGARSEEVYFTSGGTESNNFALKGIASAAGKKGKNHILISAIEHHAVLHPARSLREMGFNVDVIPVDGYGVIDLDYVQAATTLRTCLISIMHSNNEIGTIQPLQEVAQIAKNYGAVFHTDAVQSAGKIPFAVSRLGVHLASITAHKMYGPKGIGALYIRKGIEIDTFMEGGGQESNRRAGTENVPLAVGFAKAAELSLQRMDEDEGRLRRLKARLEKGIEAEFDGVFLNGHPGQCLPNIVNASFNADVRELDGEALIMGMDLEGIAVTSGSACSSGSLEPSHVLLAIGRDEKTARASIRFSIGRTTTEVEIDLAIAALHRVVEKQLQAVATRK